MVDEDRKVETGQKNSTISFHGLVNGRRFGNQAPAILELLRKLASDIFLNDAKYFQTTIGKPSQILHHSRNHPDSLESETLGTMRSLYRRTLSPHLRMEDILRERALHSLQGLVQALNLGQVRDFILRQEGPQVRFRCNAPPVHSLPHYALAVHARVRRLRVIADAARAPARARGGPGRRLCKATRCEAKFGEML
jgi:hypothetical protein